MGKSILIAVVVAALHGCASQQFYERLVTPTNQVFRATIGGPIFRIERTEDQLDGLGLVDVFGRKNPRGYVELRYLGLDESNNPRFRLTDIEAMTMEARSTTAAVGFGTASARSGGRSATAFGSGNSVGVGVHRSTQYLGPNVTEFVFDLDSGKYLEVGGVVVKIIKVEPLAFTYSIAKATP